MWHVTCRRCGVAYWTDRNRFRLVWFGGHCRNPGCRGYRTRTRWKLQGRFCPQDGYGLIRPNRRYLRWSLCTTCDIEKRLTMAIAESIVEGDAGAVYNGGN